MNNAPLFSIITITRNNLTGFRKTHKSIVKQSFQNFEWIIVDGASTDGTIQYIQSCNLNSFCKSEFDEGIYHAMNKGIERSSGEYLLFLNAGDELADADILSTLAKSITAYRPDFIYGDALEERHSQFPFYKKARSHKKFLLGMFTHHQSMLYRRMLVDDLRYNQSYKIASDYQFTVVFLQKAKNVHYIPCAICLFESGGISQTQQKLGRTEQFIIRQRLKLCSLPIAWFIYGLQTVSANLKKHLR